MSERSVSVQLPRLKASRTAKKGSITKRIRQLETLVADGGSRKFIRKLIEALQVVYQELQQVCDQISELTDEVDPLNCLEQVRFDVETCVAEAAANLEDRKDEPPSSGSIASTWVQENFLMDGSARHGGNGYGSPEEPTEVRTDMQSRRDEVSLHDVSNLLYHDLPVSEVSPIIDLPVPEVSPIIEYLDPYRSEVRFPMVSSAPFGGADDDLVPGVVASTAGSMLDLVPETILRTGSHSDHVSRSAGRASEDAAQNEVFGLMGINPDHQVSLEDRNASIGPGSRREVSTSMEDAVSSTTGNITGQSSSALPVFEEFFNNLAIDRGLVFDTTSLNVNNVMPPFCESPKVSGVSGCMEGNAEQMQEPWRTWKISGARPRVPPAGNVPRVAAASSDSKVAEGLGDPRRREITYQVSAAESQTLFGADGSIDRGLPKIATGGSGYAWNPTADAVGTGKLSNTVKICDAYPISANHQNLGALASVERHDRPGIMSQLPVSYAGERQQPVSGARIDQAHQEVASQGQPNNGRGAFGFNRGTAADHPAKHSFGGLGEGSWPPLTGEAGRQQRAPGQLNGEADDLNLRSQGVGAFGLNQTSSAKMIGDGMKSVCTDLSHSCTDLSHSCLDSVAASMAAAASALAGAGTGAGTGTGKHVMFSGQSTTSRDGMHRTEGSVLPNALYWNGTQGTLMTTAGEAGGHRTPSVAGVRGGYQGMTTAGEQGGYPVMAVAGEPEEYRMMTTAGEPGGYQAQSVAGGPGGYQVMTTTGEPGGYQAWSVAGGPGRHWAPSAAGGREGNLATTMVGDIRGHRARSVAEGAGGYQVMTTVGEAGEYQSWSMAGGPGECWARSVAGDAGGYQVIAVAGEPGGYQAQSVAGGPGRHWAPSVAVGPGGYHVTVTAGESGGYWAPSAAGGPGGYQVTPMTGGAGGDLGATMVGVPGGYQATTATEQPGRHRALSVAGEVRGHHMMATTGDTGGYPVSGVAGGPGRHWAPSVAGGPGGYQVTVTTGGAGGDLAATMVGVPGGYQAATATEQPGRHRDLSVAGEAEGHHMMATTGDTGGYPASCVAGGPGRHWAPSVAGVPGRYQAMTTTGEPGGHQAPNVASGAGGYQGMTTNGEPGYQARGVTRGAGGFQVTPMTGGAGSCLDPSMARVPGGNAATIENNVDSWIDHLQLGRAASVVRPCRGISSEVMMGWMVQQFMPKVELPKFDGAATGWVEFITKFHDVVHQQDYLTDRQKSQILVQHLQGEAKTAVRSFSNDPNGYVLALRRLKYMFGQRSTVAQAVLAKVTKGKVVQENDLKSLSELYYSITECLVTLQQLNYFSDLHSSETLRQAVQKLPTKMQLRWAEKVIRIRVQEEPSLIHLHEWLEEKMQALKEARLPRVARKATNVEVEIRNDYTAVTGVDKNTADTETLNDFTAVTGIGDAPNCKMCGGKHQLWKCEKFKELGDTKRFDLVKKQKHCFNCLQQGHQVKDCTSRNTCLEPGCSEKHHTSLHKYFATKVEKEAQKDAQKEAQKAQKEAEKEAQKEAQKKQQQPKDDQVEDGKNIATLFTSMKNGQPEEVILQIVPVRVHNAKGDSIDTYAILDNCSQVTLIREDIVGELDLTGKSREVNLTTVNEVKRITRNEVTFDVSSRCGSYRTTIKSAQSTPLSMFNMPNRPSLRDFCDVDAFTHLDGVDLEAVPASKVTVLIGADSPESVLATNVRHGEKGQPLAVQTKFGWTLFGPTLGKACHTKYNASTQASREALGNSLQSFWTDHCPSSASVNLIQSRSDLNLHDRLETFWKQENCGILPQKDVTTSREDEEAMIVMEQGTEWDGQKYVVPMLWKSPKTTLPNNYPLARKRFSFLEKKLRANPELHAKMNSIITGYLQADPPQARLMTRKEAARTSSRTWYLPMHPVTNPNKPDKIRVVNDAAAEFQGTSLNKLLVTGPDLLNSLVGNLMRFRTGKVGIAADVEAMYHQVRVPPDDADSLRFLWKEDIYSDEPPDVYQMLVHIFGAKDSSGCANYALQRAARDNCKGYDGLTFESCLKAFYVDDLLKATPSSEVAIKLSLELISIMSCGGFRLTKFTSNCRELLGALPRSEVSDSAIVDIDFERIERALGVLWDTKTDDFTFSNKLKETVDSKRGILRTTASIFDPMGFLGPFIMKARMLLQELWKLLCEWDKIIEGKLKSMWDVWIAGAKKVSWVRIPRQFNTSDKPVVQIQLHTFCDASEAAFGCVVYVRFTYKDGTHSCSFVMSKSRLAPIKAITLPRLELNAARAGARLAKLVVHEIGLPVEEMYYWSDSTITLQYIYNRSNRLRVFEGNRVSDILEVSKASQWRHLPGRENPADLITRGVNDPTLLMKGSWFPGAKFLLEDESHWPRRVIGDLPADDPAIRRKTILVAMGIFTKVEGMNLAKFSNWMRLKRVVGWIIRFSENCQNCESKRKLDEFLSVQELKVAEDFIVNDVQRVEFEEDIKALQGGNMVSLKSALSKLDPYLDSSGILRVGGRLKKINIPEGAKHPPILPRKHPVTSMLITWVHRRNGHVGPDHTLSLLRDMYWVLGARTAINMVINRCFFCKVRRAKRLFPFMSDLPTCRAAIGEPPFCQTGLDFIGPVLIKQGRKRLKRWIVLFTCLTVRCVHLEVVESSETDAFISSVRRFVNRRGCPSAMYSDNGTNIRGITSELKEVVQGLDKTVIQNFAATFKIDWHFNPPKAPHMGGSWERLVCSVKKVLRGLIKDHVLTDHQLYTWLTEVENIINSRPLTHVSNDISNMDALTPNHILLGQYRNWGSVADTSEADITSRKQWRQVQGLRARFWERWVKEYLPTLTARPKWRKKLPNLKVGALVIIGEDGIKRGKWPLGRVAKVMPGVDGTVRVAEVKTKDGVYTRPVAKLFQLEDDIEDTACEGESDD